MELTEKYERVLYHSSHEIDHSKFNPKDDTTHWHLSRALRTMVSPQGKLSIVDDESSRMSAIYYNDKLVMTADPDTSSGDIKLETPFYGKNKVVFFENLEIHLYYVQRIVENILFFRELTSADNLYSTFSKKLNDEFSFFEELSQNHNGFLHLDFPFMFSFSKHRVVITSDNEEFTIQNTNEHFTLTFKSDYDKFQSVNLDKFLKKLNQSMYKQYVFNKIKVLADDYTVEHKDILKILNI